MGANKVFETLQKSPDDTAPYLTTIIGLPNIKGLYIFYNEELGRDIKKLFPRKVISWDEVVLEITGDIEYQVEIKWIAKEKLRQKKTGSARKRERSAKKTTEIQNELGDEPKKKKIGVQQQKKGKETKTDNKEQGKKNEDKNEKSKDGESESDDDSDYRSEDDDDPKHNHSIRPMKLAATEESDVSSSESSS